jgi:FG-GAP-like repeat
MSALKSVVIMIAVCLSQPLMAQELFVDSGQRLGHADSWAVSLEDLDGDGDLDTYLDDRIWFNDGHGVFSESTRQIGEGTTHFFDINKDGFVDAVTGGALYLNDKSWNFVPSDQTFGGGNDAYLISFFDSNDDGHVDVIANADRLYLNDGHNNFTLSTQKFGGWSQSTIAFGDLDGDGDRDIYVGIPHRSSPPFTPVADKIWFNDGQGQFSAGSQSLPAMETRSVNLFDVDLDGDLDVLLGNGIGDAVLLINDGHGVFNAGTQQFGETNKSNIRIADLDLDGDLDLFIIRGKPTGEGLANKVWLNDGKGHFSDSGLALGLAKSLASELGDLDGDGDLDAIVANLDLGKGAANTVYFNTTIDAQK